MNTRPWAPVCPYCNQLSKLVTGAVIYPHRPDLRSLNFWQCAPCAAFVGCHKAGKAANSDGTRPLGRLADAELRSAKRAAHDAFDPLWQEAGNKGAARSRAYAWLANTLKIPAPDCHIGMFDVETCRRVVAACETRKALA